MGKMKRSEAEQTREPAERGNCCGIWLTCEKGPCFSAPIFSGRRVPKLSFLRFHRGKMKRSEAEQTREPAERGNCGGIWLKYEKGPCVSAHIFSGRHVPKLDVGSRQAQGLNPLSKFQSSWGPHKPNTHSNECPSHPW